MICVGLGPQQKSLTFYKAAQYFMVPYPRLKIEILFYGVDSKEAVILGKLLFLPISTISDWPDWQASADLSGLAPHKKLRTNHSL